MAPIGVRAYRSRASDKRPNLTAARRLTTQTSHGSAAQVAAAATCATRDPFRSSNVNPKGS
jgi:hypothetical protein